ncbi:13975_t:CDS:2, partial [Cetraspora pellucida]
TQIYKNEMELLNEFKKYVNRKKIKNKQDKNNFKSKKQSKEKNTKKEYKLQPSKYTPESPIYIPQSPST